MAFENPNFSNGEHNNAGELIPDDILMLLDTFKMSDTAFEHDIEGSVDKIAVNELFQLAYTIAPYINVLDAHPIHKQSLHEIINQLRRIPRVILDEFTSEQTKDYLRLQFESLPDTAADRIVTIDFASYHDIRMFPAELIQADFSDAFTIRMLDQMKFDFYVTPAAIDKIFDIYHMDEEKESEDEEDDEDGEPVTEGDEQKAMVAVLSLLMLPTQAKFYDQVMDALDKFTHANYDMNKMDMSVFNALPLIDELGKAEKEIFENILDDLAVQIDDRGEKWNTLIQQLMILDTRSNQWNQLLHDVDEMNTNRNEVMSEISKLEAAGFSLYDEEWQDANKRLQAITPKGVSYVEDPTKPTAEDQRALQEMEALAELEKLYGIMDKKMPGDVQIQPTQQQQAQHLGGFFKRWFDSPEEKTEQDKARRNYSNVEILQFLEQHSHEPFHARMADQMKRPGGTLNDAQHSRITETMNFREWSPDQKS
jgi:hypothetical protein